MASVTHTHTHKNDFHLRASLRKPEIKLPWLPGGEESGRSPPPGNPQGCISGRTGGAGQSRGLGRAPSTMERVLRPELGRRESGPTAPTPATASSLAGLNVKTGKAPRGQEEIILTNELSSTMTSVLSKRRELPHASETTVDENRFSGTSVSAIVRRPQYAMTRRVICPERLGLRTIRPPETPRCRRVAATDQADGGQLADDPKNRTRTRRWPEV